MVSGSGCIILYYLVTLRGSLGCEGDVTKRTLHFGLNRM